MIPEIVQVVPIDDYKVNVYFDDGKIVCYDASGIIEKGAFTVLKDIQIFKETCTINNFNNITQEEQKEVCNFVLSGLEQIKQGKTKDFDEVCDRLEKKYSNFG